ncbi:hypothetical protein ACHAXS_000417 [Conticribra weissflogii]
MFYNVSWDTYISQNLISPFNIMPLNSMKSPKSCV